MSVVEAYLFCSTTSRLCIPPMAFLQKNRLPIQLVRLDTAEARRAVMSSKTNRITAVPTLMVIYDDHTTQMIVGQPDVMTWLHRAIEQPIPEPDVTSIHFSDDDSSEDEKPRRKKKGKSKKTGSKSGSKTETARGLYDDGTFDVKIDDVEEIDSGGHEDIEFFEADDSVEVETKPKPAKNKMAETVAKAKKLQAEAEEQLGFKFG